MDAQIELHIFTNPVEKPVFNMTYQSFVHTFGYLEPQVWCHSSPDDKYVNNLAGFYVNFTQGLADGYIRAIQESKADYLFMLEHDWEFLNIDHRLEDIIDMMGREGLHYLRFNKRDNTPAVWDKWLEEIQGDIPYCKTPQLSNNPHIIDRKKYLKYVKYIQRLGGSKGVEECISKHLDGYIYGGLDHPATIRHLNGRG
jgi:hypothetical protein